MDSVDSQDSRPSGSREGPLCCCYTAVLETLAESLVLRRTALSHLHGAPGFRLQRPFRPLSWTENPRAGLSRRALHSSSPRIGPQVRQHSTVLPLRDPCSESQVESFRAVMVHDIYPFATRWASERPRMTLDHTSHPKGPQTAAAFDPSRPTFWQAFVRDSSPLAPKGLPGRLRDFAVREMAEAARRPAPRCSPVASRRRAWKACLNAPLTPRLSRLRLTSVSLLLESIDPGGGASQRRAELKSRIHAWGGTKVGLGSGVPTLVSKQHTTQLSNIPWVPFSPT